MTLIFITGLVLCAIAGVVAMVHGSGSRATLQAVDVTAFRALMDREDERFLRENLSVSAFFRIKRQRVLLSGRYTHRIAVNAAAVMRLTTSARMTHDPEIMQTASQLAELATQIRLQCLLAFAKLSMEFAFPMLQLNPTMVAQKYQSLWENVSRLNESAGQLQFVQAYSKA
jgi:hypothetical protein